MRNILNSGFGTHYKIIENREEFLDVVGMCKVTKTFCFDFETTGLDWFSESEKATLLSISFQHGFSYILPLYHFESHFSDDEIRGFFQILGDDIFNNIAINKIAHNLKFDLHWMNRYGVTQYDGRFNDTMLMSHILDENGKHGLKDLTKKYFVQFTGYEDEVKNYDWNKVPLAILAKYAALDTDLTLRLYHLFESMLIDDRVSKDKIREIRADLVATKQGDYRGTGYEQLSNLDYWKALELKPYRLYTLYRNLVMPSFFSLFGAERFGAKIDLILIKNSISEAEKVKTKKYNELISLPEIKKFEENKRLLVHKEEIEKLEVKIKQRIAKYKVGTKIELGYREKIRAIKSGELVIYEGINFSSPAQIKEFLFTEIGLNLSGHKDRNNKEILTTNRDFLLELADKHKFVLLLLAYRSITTMIATYYKGILDRLDSDNRLHTSFLLHGTKSGRLSSRNPNLQNIPARIKFNDVDAENILKKVKKFFIPLDSTYYFVQVDYSQAELRVIANFSGDKKMIEAYKNNYDIHAITASQELGLTLDQFYKLPGEEITRYRMSAKGTNFGLVYDMSIKGYREYAKTNYGIDMTYKEAESKYIKFFTTYSDIKNWHHDFIQFAKGFGYVRTLFGRKRRLLYIHDEGSIAQGSDIRMAINSPIQGTSGELTLFAAAILRHRLPKDCIFFNTVHDSLFFYIPKHRLEKYLPIIKNACENPPIKEYFDIWSGDVPMKVDVEISDTSWGDLCSMETFSDNKF